MDPITDPGPRALKKSGENFRSFPKYSELLSMSFNTLFIFARKSYNCHMKSYDSYIILYSFVVCRYIINMSLHSGYFCMLFCCLLFYSKYSSRNRIRVSKSLDPDQARHFVGPDLGPNCLQRLSADTKSSLLSIEVIIDAANCYLMSTHVLIRKPFLRLCDQVIFK